MCTSWVWFCRQRLKAIARPNSISSSCSGSNWLGASSEILLYFLPTICLQICAAAEEKVPIVPQTRFLQLDPTAFMAQLAKAVGFERWLEAHLATSIGTFTAQVIGGGALQPKTFNFNNFLGFFLK